MKQSIDSLTGLRFIAAFMVVLVHFGNPPSPQLLHNILSQGFVAVSVFFILSGFILTYSYCDHEGRLNTSKWGFWVARFARIYPVYLLAFLIAAPMALDEIKGMETGSLFANTALYGGAALTLTQAWSSASALVWNSPGWSLSAEAFFYLVFPFVAPLILRLQGRSLFLAGFVFWLASLGACMAYFGFADFHRNLWVFNPLLRLPEFLLGIVLGRCWQLRKPGAFEKYAAFLSLASAAAIATLFSMTDREVFFYNGALAPLIMLLIFSLACQRGLLARFLAARPMVVLGEASYSLYILHWPLWFAITAFLVNDLQRFQKGAMHFVVCEVATITASILTFKYLEKPANRYLKKTLLLLRKPEPVQPAF